MSKPILVTDDDLVVAQLYSEGFAEGIRTALRLCRDIGAIPSADPDLLVTVADVAPHLRIDISWVAPSLAGALFPEAVLNFDN